ncbi:polyprenol phosphomannose-dependent alpha 1,6 mannosyltransferase MptB [Corynebacterium sp. sy039]|uniref:polyprenol phosphomannose-dependent alpha 1,6 mannosyltransferase MptB n=1 Tax=Corynebacterium sp. sy039 TaxID=2599641 RepID=UPI00143CF675|nr:polyprenol phosphomannose-dependent alpha 1,6 mannosyltransferase MptB [Corynebacterium sp. sy039]
MKLSPFRLIQALAHELPRIGAAGSRSASLHQHQTLSTKKSLAHTQLRRFGLFRWLGTSGSLLLGLGGLGAGALPVVNNPYVTAPLGNILARMFQTSTVICVLGIGLLVVAWIGIAAFCGVSFKQQTERSSTPYVDLYVLRRTFIAWSLPLLCSAPMFTQDIYSYIANGAIVRAGLDPYSAGPIDLLGSDNPLARSVPFVWAHSASPYGSLALGIGALISSITHDSIVWAVLLHRIFSILGIALAGWATIRLAQRCSVAPQAAMWLGVLNPLTFLHLIAGIHNEAILLGLLLAGMEYGLRAIEKINGSPQRFSPFYVGKIAALLALSAFLISCAGLIKITGFMGLGFVGTGLARALFLRWTEMRKHNTTSFIVVRHILSLLTAIIIQSVLMVITIAIVSSISGVGIGWLHTQGGAAQVFTLRSITTAVGAFSGFLGMWLGLGDHTAMILILTRSLGLIIAGIFMLRMLFATYKGTIAAIGALGISTFVLVIFFPVVQPWYLLWAIFPLAAWANRHIFRLAVIAYSILLSFFVLPRGMGLPDGTLFSIYATALTCSSILLLIFWRVLKKSAPLGLN